MVLPDSHGVPRVPRYSGTGYVQFWFGYGAVTRSGEAFQLSSPAYYAITYFRPYNPDRTNPAGLGSSLFARRY